MDPNATLAAIINAAVEGRVFSGPDSLENLALDLAMWIWKGGHLPNDPRGG